MKDYKVILVKYPSRESMDEEKIVHYCGLSKEMIQKVESVLITECGFEVPKKEEICHGQNIRSEVYSNQS